MRIYVFPFKIIIIHKNLKMTTFLLIDIDKYDKWEYSNYEVSDA